GHYAHPPDTVKSERRVASVEPLDRSTIWPYRDGRPGDFYYQRYAHPTGAEAERVLGELDGGEALLFPSGSAALTALVLAELEHGADYAVHSATKYLGGHDDLLLGAVVCGDRDAAARLRELRGRTGMVAPPDSAWLLLRSLKTLRARVERQTASASELAERLQ